MKNRGPGFLSLAIIFLFCMATSCRKSSERRTSTYDFSWTYEPHPGIPSYASLYYFNFSSTAPASSTFSWNFGDGTTSDFYAPVHVFSATGTYRVSLTIDGDSAHAIVKYLHVDYYLAHTFSYTGTPLPDSVLRFVSNVPPDSSFYWEFGDGATSTDSIPSHAYSASGSYGVRLTINGHTASAVTVPVTILINPGHTREITGLQSWHHGYYLIMSSDTTFYTEHPDTTFELVYVNPVKVRFGSNLLNYNPYKSTDSILNFGSSYTDNTGNTHSINVYFNHFTDSVRINKYDRISAGGQSEEVWNAY